MRAKEFIFEDLSYPKKVSPAWILSYIEKLHTGPFGDVEELEGWVYRFKYYILTWVDLNNISLKAVSNKQDKIDRYAVEINQYPPIVFDSTTGWIIDGYHRANAAKNRGDAKILAYIGK